VIARQPPSTTWQQFYVSGPLQAGLTALAMQIGGAHTIAGGQVYQVWDAVVAPVSTDEGSGTNILPSSQQVGGASWGVQSGTATNNTVVAPDGTATAETLTASSGSSDTYQWDLVSNPAQYSGEQVTASIYLRVPSGTQTINLYIDNSGVSGWSIAAQSTVTLNTSWQRFALTATTKPSLSQLYLQIGGAGTLTSGHSINVWGAQMVVGSNPEGYVPTQNTTTVTGTSQALAANGLNETYNYDSFGNLQEAGTWSFLQGYTKANQLTGWNYDAAGNLLTDGLGNNYIYDGEGKITSGGGVVYYYTAEGQRAGKSGSVPVDTIYFAGRPIARLSGTAWTDLIYGPNGLLAEVPGTQTGAPIYRMTDHLGSLVGTLSSTGAVLSTQDVAPFGEIFTGGSSDPYAFTGKERDVESNNDYFGARFYASNMGRFMSPDPGGIAYANPYNPQSLNLYSYVVNNPLSNIDPTGMECLWDDGSFDSADDKETGDVQGCTSQGGTFVNPDLFENALLTNGQNANIQYGSWSGSANSTLASSWLGASSSVIGPTGAELNAVDSYVNDVNYNLGLESGFTTADVWTWAAKPNTQNGPRNWKALPASLYYHGNYCGAGGTGDPVDALDASCMVHDFFYNKYGYSMGSNFQNPFSDLDPDPTLQKVNQGLCDGASAVGGFAGGAVQGYFTYGVTPITGGSGVGCR
jgi:RHS repeat-associated protein